MTQDEYIDLFHRAEVNLVAFKPVFHCENELRKMVEMAIEKEREACAKLFDDRDTGTGFYEPHEPAEIIRARGQA